MSGAPGDALRPIVARLDRRLIPFLLLMYVLAFLDRTNIGFAQEGLRTDRGIGTAAYALGAGLFFVGYALVEVPSNLILARVGARAWMARIMVSWGLVAAAMAAVRGPASFHASRALLGIAEAGFFPGIILYLTLFYPAAHRARALGLFYLGAPISFVAGAPLSGLLLELDGLAGLHGWQWMFLVEGLAASAVGVAAWFVLADRPEEARWLSAAEQATLAEALARETAAPHRPASSLAFLRVPSLPALAAIYAAIQVVVYGLVFFLPHQVAVLTGRPIGLSVGIYTALPWLAALVAALAVPAGVARIGRVGLVGAATLTGAAAGLAVSALASTPSVALAGLCLAAAGSIAVQPLFWAIATARLGGAAAAGGIALVNAVGAAASFAAPNLRVWTDTAAGYDGAGLLAIAAPALAGAAGLAALDRRPG